MKKDHKVTSDFKLQFFGYGEWVEEPDELDFYYKGFHCAILRTIVIENLKVVHGGNLCGYVSVPKQHLYYGKKYQDMDIDCHGGLSFGEFDSNLNEFVIGFDCAHSFDIVPSNEIFRKNYLSKEIYAIMECREFCFQGRSYKNINYCIEECKSIVDQLIVLHNKHIQPDHKDEAMSN